MLLIKKLTHKTLLTAALMSLLISHSSIAKPTADKVSTDLNITVSGIKALQGNIMIAVYDNVKAFNSGSMDVHSLLVIKATKSKLAVVLKDFPKGRYAVSVLHDKDGNGDMNVDNKQMPLEAYAFSKTRPLFSLPKFEDAEFTHSANTSLNLKLVQP